MHYFKFINVSSITFYALSLYLNKIGIIIPLRIVGFRLYSQQIIALFCYKFMYCRF